ncbi:hypothetical protein WDZ92_49870, partial [Nostoc sp. NIES-2111]
MEVAVDDLAQVDDASEDEAAKVQAQRAKTLAARQEFAAVALKAFDELAAKVRQIALCQLPGVSIDEHLRQCSEAARRLQHDMHEVLNLPHRWAREDAGEIRQEKARLRETKPASSIRWGNLATPLLNAMG